MLRLFDRARILSLSRFEAEQVWPLLTCGLVHPYGPTLMGLAILGDWERESTELVYFSLNPHAQDLLALAEYTGEEPLDDFDWQLVHSLNRFRLAGEHAPTLVMPSHLLSIRETRLLLRQLLSQARDLPAALKRLRDYRGDPRQRVSAQVLQTMEEVSRQLDGEAVDAEGLLGAATPSQVDAYLEILLSREHREQELEALLLAWSSAIDAQSAQSDLQSAPPALPFPRFAWNLARLLGTDVQI